MQNKLPLVSVIIPTFNRERLICQAIDSLLGQTYKNIEIIVVDDGSTDNTKKTIESYINKLGSEQINTQTVKYLYKQNGGVSTARNYGLKEASGGYIAFLDSDDTWLPEKTSKQLSVLELNINFDIAISEIEFVDSNCSRITNYRKEIPINGQVFDYLVKSLKVTCASAIFRKKVLSKIGAFDETLSTGEDIDLLLRAGNLFDIVLIDEVLVKCSKQNCSLSANISTGNRLRVLDKISSYSLKINSSLIELIRKTKARVYLSYAKDLLWHGYINEAQKKTIASLKTNFTLKGTMLFVKSLLIRLVSLVIPKYKDKGQFNGK